MVATKKKIYVGRSRKVYVETEDDHQFMVCPTLNHFADDTFIAHTYESKQAIFEDLPSQQVNPILYLFECVSAERTVYLWSDLKGCLIKPVSGHTDARDVLKRHLTARLGAFEVRLYTVFGDSEAQQQLLC